MYFSIIVPTYNDDRRLNLLLDYFSEQSLENRLWEIIVVNNNPVKPLNLCKDYSRDLNLTLCEEKKPGSYAARNKGVEFAKGNIIGFTDSDCLPDLDWLKNAMEVFSNDNKNEIGVLTGPVPLFFKDPLKLSDAEIYEKYTGFTTHAYAKDGHAITANWFSYKSVINEFGGFDPELKSNGDSELSERINKKYKIIFKHCLIVKHPARFRTEDLVNKYKRLIGGTFARKYTKDEKGFKKFVFLFLWKRYRFALKKLITISPKESFAIWRVCHSVNKGVFEECKNLLNGFETKR